MNALANAGFWAFPPRAPVPIGRLTGTGQQMALYARSGLGRRGYVTGLASVDRHRIDTQRRVLAGNTLGSVIGQHTDNSTLLRLETGVHLGAGLTPYFAAGHLSLRQGGFSESGLLGLTAAADTFNAAFADLGTRFERSIGRWMLGGTLAARRMFGGTPGFNAAFTGAEAAAFSISGQPLSRHSLRFGHDLSYRSRHGWHYSLGLGNEHMSGQRRNAWGEATVKWNF